MIPTPPLTRRTLLQLVAATSGAGLLLLLTVTLFDWIVLVLPAWVAIVSLFIVRRERARSRAATEG